MSFFFFTAQTSSTTAVAVADFSSLLRIHKLSKNSRKKSEKTENNKEDDWGLEKRMKKYYLTPFCWFVVILLVSKTKTFLPYIDSYPNLTFSWKQLLQKGQNGRINDNRTNPEHAHPLLDVSTLTLTPLHPNHRYLCTF